MDANCISIAECLKEQDADQIVSEYNNHDRLVAALENLEMNLEGDRYVDPLKRELYLAQIRQALAQAKGES